MTRFHHLSPLIPLALLLTFTFSVQVFSQSEEAESRRYHAIRNQGGASPFSSLLRLDDVFPLAPNLRYLYDYYSYSEIYFFRIENLAIDSGLVEYIVRDSSIIDDSTLAWNVEQRATLWHGRYGLYGKLDSQYTTQDTLHFVLAEVNGGKHELRANSLVWKFPLTAPNQPVYRYADTSAVLMARRGTTSGIPLDQIDSLWFSQHLGFHRRELQYMGGGITIYSGATEIQLRGIPTGIRQPDETLVPNLTLSQNYPNPFNSSTTIQFQLDRTSHVQLILYDVLGRQLRLLINAPLSAGLHQIRVGLDDLASGVYLYSLRTPTARLTKRMILVK